MKKIKPFFSEVVIAIFLPMTSTVEAGMSTVTLSKFGADRLIGISTVLFVLLVVVSTLLLVCWNKLVKGSTWPKLSHPKAVGLTFLAGLLSFLVLVMIAGSRELLTPKAWRPKGILYELAPLPSHETGELQPDFSAAFDPATLVPEEDTPAARLAVRRENLTRIRNSLWQYADTHGDFPVTLPENLQTIPVSGGMKYAYRPSDEFLVAEPDLHEGPRLAINRRGVIVSLDIASDVSSKPADESPVMPTAEKN